MTIQPTTQDQEVRTCPYCDKPYPFVTIPALWDIPERTFQSSVCGCEGELKEQAKKRLAVAAQVRVDAMNRMGIPKRYQEVVEDTTYLNAIDDDGGLYFYGLVGRGKTWLAVATMKAWLNRNPLGHAVFTDTMTLLANIRKSYDENGSEYDAVSRYAHADLLVFDDFAKGRPSEWATERIEYIIQKRYEDMKPTIYTSQWVGGDLIKRLSEGGSKESAIAIVSRITQTCQLVELTGPDRRTA